MDSTGHAMKGNVKNRVRDRLAMVKYLIEANHPLSIPIDAGPTKGANGTADGSWIHTHDQLDGLVSYLLLTCFDALGQTDDWVAFNKWLTSADHETERCEALRGCPNTDAVAGAKHLLGCYNRRYGARRAFMNFIDNVLLAGPRRQLLESVRLIRLTIDGAKVLDPEHKKKREVLYELRNSFTHSAKIYGTARMPDGTRFAPALATEPDQGPFPSNNLYTDRDYLCMVHDWPFSLYTAVSNALGDTVPDFQVDYTVALGLSSNRTVFLKTTRRGLADSAQRAALFKRAEELVTQFIVNNAAE